MMQTYRHISRKSKLIQADIDTVDSKYNTLFVRDLKTNKEIVMSVSTLKKYWTVINNTP